MITVRFHPDTSLKGHFVDVRASQSKYVRHSEKVSGVEIDMLLKEYFAGHQMMTRRDFQEICGTSFTISRVSAMVSVFAMMSGREGCEKGFLFGLSHEIIDSLLLILM